MERTKIPFDCSAGGQFPGQLVQAGATDVQGGLELSRLEASPVALNQTGNAIQRDHQPERRAVDRSRIQPRNLGGRQVQFRLGRLAIHELIGRACVTANNFATQSRFAPFKLLSGVQERRQNEESRAVPSKKGTLF